MPISQMEMLVRFTLALVLGAVMGLERELAGKEAGIRTCMLVSAGAGIFTIIALNLPSIVALSTGNLSDLLAHNAGFLSIIANIVLGVGFLGGGIIVKSENHVHGLTTAAVVWATAAIGILAGLGMIKFAIISTILIVCLLYLLRRMDIASVVKRINED